jgi:hypothetical protein
MKTGKLLINGGHVYRLEMELQGQGGSALDASFPQDGGEGAPKLTAGFPGPRAESKRGPGGTLLHWSRNIRRSTTTFEPRPKLSAASIIPNFLVQA